MKIKEGSTITSPSNERIEKLEIYSRVKYPKSFISFIRDYNGGIPITNKFEVNSREYVIERFLSISDVPRNSELGDYDISVVLTQLDERLTNNPELIGDELIPFAVLFAGDFVCLDFRQNETPSIVVWYHEKSEEFNPITSKVADNFSDFIDMLKE